MGSEISDSVELYLENGFWKLRMQVAVEEFGDADESPLRSKGSREPEPIWVGMATGPKGLTENEAQEMVRIILLSQLRARRVAQLSSVTVAEFVERKFVPEYVASKGFFGRMHYHSMLKHVVNPEVVDRLFHPDIPKTKTRLQSVQDWPYLGHVPLQEVRPASVQSLTSAALTRGYSTQTVAHIRNVISTIFAHAKKEMYFSGDNPARLVQLPKVNRPELPLPSRAEVIRLMSAMDYPEKEMTLMAISTGMNIAEICGLRWKRVNLSDDAVLCSDNEAIPPGSLIVREELARGRLIDVTSKRKITCQVPRPLLNVLRGIAMRGQFTEPDDFVLVCRTGRPINPSNILKRRLKPIGEKLDIPRLSWQHLRRIHRALLAEFGAKFPDQIERLVEAASPASGREIRHSNWIAEAELPY